MAGRKIHNKLITIMIMFVIVLGSFTYSRAEVEYEYPFNMSVTVDDRTPINVRAFNYYYSGNVYVSLRDMAVALSGTSKAYDVGVKDSNITIKTGMDYIATGGENTPYGEEINATDYSLKYNFKRNQMKVDDIERKYYSVVMPNSAGNQDCFLTITDFAMLFDLDMTIDGENVSINTNASLDIDLDALKNEGFFRMVNSAIVGDATTGEIYFETNGGASVPMASTTKLMTYVVAMDAVAAGKISLDDPVTFSYNVEKLANTSDGVIKLKEGDHVSLNDALIGMMLPSSNEMALAIAETIAGDEAEFVRIMNEKARSIGMSDATVFYNCNGLPTFSNTVLVQKRQNMVSSEDMFKLVQYTMAVYPSVTDITSLKSYRIDNLEVTVTNTNPLLYNLDGVVGLKTGTTTKAGYCLVTVMNVECDDGVHSLMSAEFGSENPYTRGMVSELMLRYAERRLKSGETDSSMESDGGLSIETPEKLITFLLN